MKRPPRNERLIVSAVFSLYAWIVFIFMTVFWFTLTFFIRGWAFFQSRREVHRAFHMTAIHWGRSILAFIPSWKLHLRGLEHLEPGQHYVIVANHQSLLDILLALASLPVQFRFLAKKELFKVPFLGWHIALAGYLPVNRSDPKSRREAMLRAKATVAGGTSVLMFPEGTRTPDGEIHKFKPGAFRLAQAEGVPILPVVLDGTWHAIPKKSLRFEPGMVFKCLIGKPVRIKPEEDLAAAIEALRGRMAETLRKTRPRPGRSPKRNPGS